MLIRKKIVWMRIVREFIRDELHSGLHGNQKPIMLKL